MHSKTKFRIRILLKQNTLEQLKKELQSSNINSNASQAEADNKMKER